MIDWPAVIAQTTQPYCDPAGVGHWTAIGGFVVAVIGGIVGKTGWSRWIQPPPQPAAPAAPAVQASAIAGGEIMPARCARHEAEIAVLQEQTGALIKAVDEQRESISCLPGIKAGVDTLLRRTEQR